MAKELIRCTCEAHAMYVCLECEEYLCELCAEACLQDHLDDVLTITDLIPEEVEESMFIPTHCQLCGKQTDMFRPVEAPQDPDDIVWACDECVRYGGLVDEARSEGYCYQR